MTHVRSLTTSSVYDALLAESKHPSPLQDKAQAHRLEQYVIENGPLQFFYGVTHLTDTRLDLLQALSDECDVVGQYKQLLAGDVVNKTEHSAVHFHRTRLRGDRGHYGAEQDRVDRFVEQCASGDIVTADGHPFESIVFVGIGGSSLGPKALHEALSGSYDPRYPVHFVCNADPDEVYGRTKGIALNRSLVIVVSKSGSTQETILNLESLGRLAQEQGLSSEQFAKHVVSVSMEGSPLDNPDYLERFYVTKEIGGRVSATSVCGGLLLSLVFGPQVFAEILEGASAIDQASLQPDCRHNMALLGALNDCWNRNFEGYEVKAVVPYTSTLSNFPLHLQQLFMESNGKQVTKEGGPARTETCPIIFGGLGTESQHSFFQLFHQGTTPGAVECIGFRLPQQAGVADHHQEVLLANLVSQMIAFSDGRTSDNPHKACPGGRPSTLIFAKQLTAYTMGALLAFYENTMMFQGFLWGINSFDQEGVELGKVLATSLLKNNNPSPALVAFYDRLLTLE